MIVLPSPHAVTAPTAAPMPSGLEVGGTCPSTLVGVAIAGRLPVAPVS